MLISPLFVPPDVLEQPWARCGHAAIAAVVHQPLGQLVGYFPDHGWLNERQAREALEGIGVSPQRTPEAPTASGPKARAWPRAGVALIQLVGPWERPGAPLVASLEQTHWIGVASMTEAVQLQTGSPCWVYDINTGSSGGWLPRDIWSIHVLGRMIASTRRASGPWWVRAAFDVTVPLPT